MDADSVPEVVACARFSFPALFVFALLVYGDGQHARRDRDGQIFGQIRDSQIVIQIRRLPIRRDCDCDCGSDGMHENSMPF